MILLEKIDTTIKTDDKVLMLKYQSLLNEYETILNGTYPNLSAREIDKMIYEQRLKLLRFKEIIQPKHFLGNLIHTISRIGYHYANGYWIENDSKRKKFSRCIGRHDVYTDVNELKKLSLDLVRETLLDKFNQTYK